MPIGQLIVIISGAVLLLAGIGLVIFQLVQEVRGFKQPLRVGMDVRGAKLQTTYAGLVVIFIGAILEVIGTYGFPH